MSAKIPSNPFNRIALCCSGGGYRAASFHLGAMSYLNKVQYKDQPLLEHVKALSTVSGGTITGVIYALHKQRGKSFDYFFQETLDQLHSLDLIAEGLQKLNRDGHWNTPSKNKNLINAFAEIYDQAFTDGATFSEFDTMKSHLETVIFNATEFHHALAFRFQNEGIFGNYFFLKIPKAAEQEVKLSDVIASSSCFPGGFEPLIWPHDYRHKNSPNLDKLTAESESVGIMDGGIYDNQGIDSILTAERRHRKKEDEEPYYDLVIVSDVASPYMEAFKPREPVTNGQGFRAHSLNSLIRSYTGTKNKYLIILLIVTLVFALIPLSVNYANNWITGMGLSVAAVLLIISLAVVFIDKKIKARIREGIEYLNGLLPAFYQEKLGTLSLGNHPFGTLEPLIINRVSSVVTMTMDVFLKVARRLNYYKLYEKDEWAFRRLSNLIKEITREDYENKQEMNQRRQDFYQNLEGCHPDLKGSYEDVFGNKIAKVAQNASDVGTTLWFTKEEKDNQVLDQLVAAGQFNMCFNLLVYLTEIMHTPDSGFEDLPDHRKKDLQNLFDDCMKDWTQFKNDPMFLINQLTLAPIA